MSERDLDIAIEKCERIMEMDTRTMQNPVSENGWIFEKVYELLQYLRQFQFATDTNVGGNLSVDELITFLNPESNYVFYDDAHGFCINTQDVIDHLCVMPSAQPDHIGEVTEMVGDVISREAAIETVRKAKSIGQAHRMLMQLPSAQPEIIRCKDCKWKNRYNCTRAVEVFIDDDKYCAWAERRTDE